MPDLVQIEEDKSDSHSGKLSGIGQQLEDLSVKKVPLTIVTGE